MAKKTDDPRTETVRQGRKTEKVTLEVAAALQAQFDATGNGWKWERTAPNPTDLDKAIDLAVADAVKAKDERIAELEKQLADATAGSTNPDADDLGDKTKEA